MKELPLLSSSFPYFSWETQFNNATSEQLQNGYAALTSTGKTTEFHRFIWNDMVDLLDQIQKQVGLTWDNTYGSAKETKVLEKYGKFTAQKFNAMTINMEPIIMNVWKWHVDKYYPGYVARPRFYGITEKADKADYLYGHYILELARVLNQIIATLKNEADFADFVIREKSSTPTEVTTLSQRAAALAYKRSDYTNPNVQLIRETSRPMYLTVYSYTENAAVFEYIGVKHLSFKETSKSPVNANMTANRWARAASNEIIKAPYEINMENPKVGRMISANKSAAPYTTSMINPQVGIMESPNYSGFKYEAESVAGAAAAQTSELISATNSKTDVIVSRFNFIGSEITSRTNPDADMVAGNPKRLELNESDRTITEAKLFEAVQAKMTPKLAKSKTTVNSVLIKKPLLGLAAKLTSKTKTYTDLWFEGMADNEWHTQVGSDLFIHQIYDGYKEESDLYIDTEYWLEPIQNGTDLFIRQIYDEQEVKGE